MDSGQPLKRVRIPLDISDWKIFGQRLPLLLKQKKTNQWVIGQDPWSSGYEEKCVKEDCILDRFFTFICCTNGDDV